MKTRKIRSDFTKIFRIDNLIFENGKKNGKQGGKSEKSTGLGGGAFQGEMCPAVFQKACGFPPFSSEMPVLFCYNKQKKGRDDRGTFTKFSCRVPCGC